MIPELIKVVNESIERLHRWLVGNGWAGYDPYDLKGLPRFIHPSNSVDCTLRRITLRVEKISPAIPRRLFRVQKAMNAKAMGLFAEGYRTLFVACGREEYFQRAKQALEWLEEHPSKGYSGYSWGYPFDWQSRLLIPKGTPSSVVSANVGQAFWGFYQMTDERHYLDICQSICEFFMNDLHMERFDSNRICYSYTPIDNFHVHNANLLVADFLIRVGLELGKSSYVDHGMQAVAYALSEQNEDGSLCYWSRDQDDICRIDHYHSGFKIRSLYGILKSTQNPEVYRALKSYYSFYNGRLFSPEGIPKMTPESLYPIDIHSCAEAILCHSTLALDFPEALDFLQKCVPWIVKTMQHSEGWFIYMVRRIRGKFDWKLKIPYIRWGQAWMLRALAECYSFIVRREGRSPSIEEKEKP